MNEFQPIIFLARSGNHRVLSQIPYYSSEAFAQRSDLVRNEDPTDKVNVLLYMLKRIALHPEELVAIQRNLEHGLVHLRFFGYSNPVTVFWLNKDVPEHLAMLHQLKAALLENSQSRQFKAAQRILVWRTPKKAHVRDCWQRKVEARLREKLPYPTTEDYRASYEGARQREAEVAAQFRLLADKCRDRRNTRLAKLASFCHTADVTSYYELLERLALDVLTPPPGFEAEQEELTAQAA